MRKLRNSHFAQDIICARLIRHTEAWGPIHCDVVIEFDRNFEFISADFDGCAPDDAPGEITDQEIGWLRKWFEQNRETAIEQIEYVDPAVARMNTRAWWNDMLRGDI